LAGERNRKVGTVSACAKGPIFLKEPRYAAAACPLSLSLEQGFRSPIFSCDSDQRGEPGVGWVRSQGHCQASHDPYGDALFALRWRQADAPGTVDQLVDAIQARVGGAMPGTDLLLSDAYDVLTSDVIEGHHVGQGVVDGVECEHLAFRGHDTDWQIWIQTGAQPIPRKYVITSKTLSGAPQYTLRIKEWKTDPIKDADAFAFKAPEGATKVGLDSDVMMEFDEIPPGTATGAKK